MNPQTPTQWQTGSIISPAFVFSVLYFSFVTCNYTTKMMVIQGCSLYLTVLFILSIWSAASVPDILSRSVPGLLPRSVPDILSRSDPDILSRSVPDILSRSDPDIVSRSVPDIVSRSDPDILPRSVPEFLPRSVPDHLSRSGTASKFVIPKTPDKISKWPFRKSSTLLLKFFSFSFPFLFLLFLSTITQSTI
jgi:hypothetical protein